MSEEAYEFDNGWTMRRESIPPGYWILSDEKLRKVDRDQYRADLFERHKLRINGGSPYRAIVDDPAARYPAKPA